MDRLSTSENCSLFLNLRRVISGELCVLLASRELKLLFRRKPSYDVVLGLLITVLYILLLVRFIIYFDFTVPFQ